MAETMTLPRERVASPRATHGQRLTVQKAYEILQNWDMSPVRNYLVRNEGMSEEQTLAMEREYKRFLALSCLIESGVNIPISVGVDPFWHTHIIFTHDYTKMCLALGGHYIHHVPAVTDEERARLCSAYNTNTLGFYREHFGEPDPAFWPQDAQICIVCCDRDHHPDHDEMLIV